ncbi:MAG: E2/UBC family protein [Bacillota bacterium]
MGDIILEYLISKSLLADVKVIPPDEVILKNNVGRAYEGTADIDGVKVTLQVVLSKDFPLRKPRVYLKPPNILGFIPHVQNGGYVCYAHDEGLVLDLDNPTGIIDECLRRVIVTLVQGKRGLNTNDFYEEFESYWDELEKGPKWISFVEITSFVKEIVVAVSKELEVIIVGDEFEDIKRGLSRFFGNNITAKKLSSGVYIPLRAPVLPPQPGAFWNVKTLRQQIFSNISGSNSRLLKAIIKKKRIKDDAVECILISIPASKERRSVVAVSFSHFGPLSGKAKYGTFSHPLHQVDARFKITPHLVSRLDADYLLPRAGALPSLVDKKVLLVGCGSVGGFIAFELARAGVGHLTLVDEDHLSPENIHRHALGADCLYRLVEADGTKYQAMPKVLGLKVELETRYPYITVEMFSEPIRDLVREKKVMVTAFDLVVVALGNPTVELFLNRHFHTLEKCPPVVFTWNEPLGIGGHALLTRNNGRTGCLECLYKDPDEFLYNKASFAAPGQFFGRTLSGCGNVFTPYGSMDSIQTAVVATRLGISALLGQEKDNPVLSWKGDGRLFKQEYEVSPRYELSSEQLFASRYDYKLEGCPVCNHRSE